MGTHLVWIAAVPENKNYHCPVCGYPDLTEPPYDAHGCASFDICPCCGTEFGNHDFSKTHRELRLTWHRNGAHWWSTSDRPPKNWDPLDQLRRAGLAVD